MATSGKSKVWMRYVVTPLIFAVVTCVIAWVFFAPTIAPYIGFARYMFSDTPKQQAAELYSGIAENLEQSGTIALSEITYPQNGDLYGKIVVAGTNVDAPLYYGDATKQLNLGAGTYMDHPGAGIPGEGKTILIAGHNNTFFNGLQDVKEGDKVSIDTHYGRYVYEVTEMRVANASNNDTYDFTRSDENLILYTCYPFDAFGLTPQRYFVYARYVSGPVIDAAS